MVGCSGDDPDSLAFQASAMTALAHNPKRQLVGVEPTFYTLVCGVEPLAGATCTGLSSNYLSARTGN